MGRECAWSKQDTFSARRNSEKETIAVTEEEKLRRLTAQRGLLLFKKKF